MGTDSLIFHLIIQPRFLPPFASTYIYTMDRIKVKENKKKAIIAIYWTVFYLALCIICMVLDVLNFQEKQKIREEKLKFPPRMIAHLVAGCGTCFFSLLRMFERLKLSLVLQQALHKTPTKPSSIITLHYLISSQAGLFAVFRFIMAIVISVKMGNRITDNIATEMENALFALNLVVLLILFLAFASSHKGEALEKDLIKEYVSICNGTGTNNSGNNDDNNNTNEKNVNVEDGLELEMR